MSPPASAGPVAGRAAEYIWILLWIPNLTNITVYRYTGGMQMTHTPHDLTALTDLQLKQLMNDLNPARVASRKQGNTSLSYLQTWDVKATLIRIFGFGGFSAEAIECETVMIENNVPKTKGYGKDKIELPIEYAPDGQIKFGTANFRVTMRVRVRLHIHQLGATYTEWAASSQTGPDLGEVSDFAIKTAESDALKRAAIYLGTQFGLSLYNDGATQEVVKAVLAPGQEWNRGARALPPEGKPAPASESRPASAGGSVAHLRGDGVTEAQHADNLNLLDQALSAKKKQQEHAGPDVPLYADNSLSASRSSDPVEMDPDYGGDGGKAEGMAYEQV